MSGQRGVWGRLVATAFTWTIAATMIVVGTAARRAHADCQNQAGCFAISDTMDSPGKCTIVNPISGPIVIPYYDVLHSDLEVATVINGVSIITDVDTPGSVGDYPSAATDTLDHTVISYYDVSNGNLKFAIGSGSVWSLTTVDAPGRVGLYTSIARVPGGFGIAYYDSTKGDLKYAEKIGAGAWTTTTVDSIGVTGLYASLTARGSSRAITYYDATNGNLRFAIRNAGTWSTQTVDAVGNVGGYTSQVKSLTGFGVAYYDFTRHDLKFASSTSGAMWTLQTVDSAGDVGSYASASGFGGSALDSVGISYHDATRHDLKYAQKIGLWGNFPVDTEGYVGVFTSCATGPSDSLAISYIDVTNEVVKLATRQRVHTGAPLGRPTVSGARVSWSRSAHGPGGMIRYTVPSPGPVQLRLFDSQGRVVQVLIRDSLPAGADEIRWDGRDLHGRLVASGMLYVRIDTASGSASAPAVVLR
jgi:hypothetical protein